jgi:cell division protein FtsB
LKNPAWEVSLAPAREPVVTGNKNLITICLLVFIVAMLGYAVFGNRGVLRILQAERQQQQLKEQLAVLQQEQQRLRDEIDRLRNDKDYWEQLARKKLGMVREGELIYHLPAEKTEQNEKTEKTEKTRQ